MPRSKLKNSKSNSNKKIRDSKLRNNRGEEAGQSTTGSTIPKIPRRASGFYSKRKKALAKIDSRRKPASRSKSSKHVRSKSDKERKLLQRVVDARPALTSILAQSNERALRNFLEATKINRQMHSGIEAGIEHKKYKFFRDIYSADKEFSDVIQQLKNINVEKDVYLMDPSILKNIKKILNKEEAQISVIINDLIKNFLESRGKDIGDSSKNLEKYMEYLNKTSRKYFGKSSKDIHIGITKLTLFYGFTESDLSLVILNRLKKDPVLLKDYISLLNKLFINRKSIKFHPDIGYEFTVSTIQTSNRFNKVGIDKYVELRKDGKTHLEATREVQQTPNFKQKYARKK
jgi:hypothetical protein